MKSLNNILEGILDTDLDIGAEVVGFTVLKQIINKYKHRVENQDSSDTFSHKATLINVMTSNAELIKDFGETGQIAIPQLQLSNKLKEGSSALIICNLKPKLQGLLFVTKEKNEYVVWPNWEEMGITYYSPQYRFPTYNELQKYMMETNNVMRNSFRVAKCILFENITHTDINTKLNDLLR